MTLSQLLDGLGHSGSSVIPALLAKLEVGDDEVLFACGSLVENLGNPSSDIDLCLITDRAKPWIGEEENQAIQAAGFLCDVQFVHPRAIEAATTKLNALTGAPRDVRATAKTLSLREQKLLHRLLTGIAVAGDLDARCRNVSRLALSRAKLDRSQYEALGLQLDLAGMFQAGDWRSMILAAQDLLGWAADALLAASGFTNADRKWRVKLLESLPAEWGRSLPGRQLDSGAAETFMKLHRAPDTAEEAPTFLHAARIAAFTRRVFAHAEQELLPGPSDLLSLRIDPAPSGVRPDPLPMLVVDVALRRRESGFEVFRINRAAPRVTIDDGLASLLLLFDGETSRISARSAARRIWGHADGDARLQAIEMMVEQGGLAVPAPTDRDLAELLGTHVSRAERRQPLDGIGDDPQFVHQTTE